MHFRSVEDRIDRLEKTVGVGGRSSAAGAAAARRARNRRQRPEAADGATCCERIGPLACVVGATTQLHEDGAARARVRRARSRSAGAVLIHTGQHYDVAMNERLFADLELAAPGPQSRGRLGHACGADGRGHAALRAGARRPRSQLRHRRRRRQLDARLQSRGGQEERTPVVHVEAGLRSFDRADARGDQPRAHRPDRRPPLHDGALRRRQSRCAKASPPSASASSAT